MAAPPSTIEPIERSGGLDPAEPGTRGHLTSSGCRPSRFPAGSRRQVCRSGCRSPARRSQRQQCWGWRARLRTGDGLAHPAACSDNCLTAIRVLQNPSVPGAVNDIVVEFGRRGTKPPWTPPIDLSSVTSPATRKVLPLVGPANLKRSQAILAIGVVEPERCGGSTALRAMASPIHATPKNRLGPSEP